MDDDSRKPPTTAPPRGYRWPWFVLVGVVLAIVLAILWVSKEAGRTRRLREFNAPAGGAQERTNR